MVSRDSVSDRAVTVAERVVYSVDSDNVVISTNDHFDEFARGNGDPGLPDRVIGRSLFDFIAGRDVQEMWRTLLERARQTGHLSVPFRCDAAEVRRELHMAMDDARADGTVVFTSTITSTSVRQPVMLFEQHPGEGALLTMCSWCCRFHVNDWVEAEDAVRMLSLLSSTTPQVTHGLCDDCASRLRTDLERSVTTS